MSTKIFSRESLYFIYNTLNCAALEDLRTHHLQVLPQHCIWFVRKDVKKRIRKTWRAFVNGKDFNAEDMRWLNFVILNYSEWKVPYTSIRNLFETPFKKRIMEAIVQPERTPIYFGNSEIENMIEKCRLANDIIEHKLFSAPSAPSFVYVLPTGCYSRTSRAWGTFVSALETCWHSGRLIEFTKNDLCLLKQFITKSVYTTTERQGTNQHISINTNVDNLYARRICLSLNTIANTTHIFANGYLRNSQDYDLLLDMISRLRNALHVLNGKCTNSDSVLSGNLSSQAISSRCSQAESSLCKPVTVCQCTGFASSRLSAPALSLDVTATGVGCQRESNMRYVSASQAISSLAYKEITIVEPDTVPDQIHSYNETITIRVNGIKEMIDLMPLQYEPKPISEIKEINETVKWKLLAAAIAFAVLILSIIISYVFAFEN